MVMRALQVNAKTQEKPGRVKFVHIPDGKRATIERSASTSMSISGAERIITQILPRL